MSNNEQNTEVLNDLIQINNDRIKGYQNAIEELKDENNDLRTVFTEMISQSEGIKSDLVNEVKVLGEEAASGTTTSGKIYRAWMDVKAVFTGHDREAILNNCHNGEDAAQKAYQSALDTDGLSADVNVLIAKQKQELKVSHDAIKIMMKGAKAID
jgi:uncharacterized protein (TIGR02284 family)